MTQVPLPPEPERLTSKEVEELIEGLQSWVRFRSDLRPVRFLIYKGEETPTIWCPSSDGPLTLSLESWSRTIQISCEVNGREIPFASLPLFRDENGTPDESVSKLEVQGGTDLFEISLEKDSSGCLQAEITHSQGRSWRYFRQFSLRLLRPYGWVAASLPELLRKRLGPLLALVAVLVTVGSAGSWWFINERTLRLRAEHLARNLEQRLEGLSSPVGAEIITLDSSPNRGSVTVQLSPQFPSTVLLIDESYNRWQKYSEFSLTIATEEEPFEVVHEAVGLAISPNRYLAASLPGELLPPGGYKIKLWGKEGHVQAELASFSLRVEPP